MSQLGAIAVESAVIGNRTIDQTSLSKDGHLLAHVPRKDTKLAHLWVELDAGVHCFPVLPLLFEALPPSLSLFHFMTDF